MNSYPVVSDKCSFEEVIQKAIDRTDYAELALLRLQARYNKLLEDYQGLQERIKEDD
jgi:hypothetical protein